VTAALMNTTSSLFLADAVHAAPLLIGLFFAGRGMFAIGVSLGAGWLSDRMPDRRLLLVVGGVSGAVGGLCFAVLRDYTAVFVTGALFFSIGAVTFPQLFAYANEFARARGRPVTAFTSVMRSVFSASWVIAPPAGLYVLTRYGFGPLYLATAGLFLGTAVLGRWGLRPIPRGPIPRRPRRGLSAAAFALPRRTWLLLGAVIAFGVVNQMYNIDIALYVTRTLHTGAQLVGWMAGLAAGLEIPIMIVAGHFADRFGRLRVVVAAAAGATVFFCLLPLARSAAFLLPLQVLNAAWTAVALSIPMVMMQDEAPGGAGVSSALYSSGYMSAGLLAGAITGVTATAIGFGNVFWVCAALSAAAGGLLLARTVTENRGVGETEGTVPDK
jgi:SET family sugar efflux transporter-like MFS transporter